MELPANVEQSLTGLPDVLVKMVRQSVMGAKELDIQPEGFERVAALSASPGTIQLYADFGKSNRATQDLLEAVGDLILQKAGKVGQQIWKRKLCLANDGTASSFTQKLGSKQFSTYRSVVESFTGAIERLIALHLANALISQRLSIEDAYNIDVANWPATTQFASGKKAYSIIPLATAYCDPSCVESYGHAFYCRVMSKLACGRKDVKEAFVGVIDSVAAASS